MRSMLASSPDSRSESLEIEVDSALESWAGVLATVVSGFLPDMSALDVADGWSDASVSDAIAIAHVSLRWKYGRDVDI